MPTLFLSVALLVGLSLAGPIIALACQCGDMVHVVDIDADLADDSHDIDPLPVSLSEDPVSASLPPGAFSMAELGGWIPNPNHPPATPPPILG